MRHRVPHPQNQEWGIPPSPTGPGPAANGSARLNRAADGCARRRRHSKTARELARAIDAHPWSTVCPARARARVQALPATQAGPAATKAVAPGRSTSRSWRPLGHIIASAFEAARPSSAYTLEVLRTQRTSCSGGGEAAASRQEVARGGPRPFAMSASRAAAAVAGACTSVRRCGRSGALAAW
eukprot:scaffold1025_cov381-Prasinococcus_capsulatus_cf.AAC.7